jgi:hypothetical protein
MNKDTRDYLNAEFDYFQKSYEIQFTHFMGVFYFWTIVVTAPVTAGLLSKDNLNTPAFPILLGFVAFIGLFLAAKMFDIRCSQLRYISTMNRVRSALYQDSKDDLPKNYEIPFPPSTNLRRTALTDFGMVMAITMSALDAALFGFAAPPLLQNDTGFSWWAFGIFGIIGILTYLILVFSRVPEPPKEHHNNK